MIAIDAPATKTPARETQETPCGIGGLSPHPARGPVTALRVLGCGFEITVDANSAERFRGNVGDRFTVKGMTVLALDEPTSLSSRSRCIVGSARTAMSTPR